jgi:hypothetical protein
VLLSLALYKPSSYWLNELDTIAGKRGGIEPGEKCPKLEQRGTHCCASQGSFGCIPAIPRKTPKPLVASFPSQGSTFSAKPLPPDPPLVIDAEMQRQPGGRFASGGYAPFVPGSAGNEVVALGEFDAASPLMEGVHTLTSDQLR